MPATVKSGNLQVRVIFPSGPLAGELAACKPLLLRLK
jgi:hypothetical protein